MLRQLPPLAEGRRPRARMDRPLGTGAVRHMRREGYGGAVIRRLAIAVAPGLRVRQVGTENNEAMRYLSVCDGIFMPYNVKVLPQWRIKKYKR